MLSALAHLLVISKNALKISTLYDFCNIKLFCECVFCTVRVLYIEASFINLIFISQCVFIVEIAFEEHM